MIRTRRKIYSLHEKDCLIACAEKYKHILECKAPNSCSNAKRSYIWQMVSEEFNAMPGVRHCTTRQLQDLYKNIKRRKQFDTENQKLYFLTLDQSNLATDASSEKLFLTDTDPDVGVVLKPLSSPEDNKDFLKTITCKENVNTSVPSESSNLVQSTTTSGIGYIAIESVTTLANVAEPSTTASSSSTITSCSSSTTASSSSAVNIASGAITNDNEDLQKNKQPFVVQVKPVGSPFKTKYLNLYKMKRRLMEQSSANKAAGESTDKGRAPAEEQQDLAKEKLKAELEAQRNADRRAQEKHDIEIRNLRREERKMIREEKRARREAVRAEKLHALKIRCLQAKIRFFESQLGGE